MSLQASRHFAAFHAVLRTPRTPRWVGALRPALPRLWVTARRAGVATSRTGRADLCRASPGGLSLHTAPGPYSGDEVRVIAFGLPGVRRASAGRQRPVPAQLGDCPGPG